MVDIIFIEQVRPVSCYYLAAEQRYLAYDSIARTRRITHEYLICVRTARYMVSSCPGVRMVSDAGLLSAWEHGGLRPLCLGNVGHFHSVYAAGI